METAAHDEARLTPKQFRRVLKSYSISPRQVAAL